MFNTHPEWVYSYFWNHNNKEAEIPDKQETNGFWNNIWGTPQMHNAAEWTHKEYFDIPTQQEQGINKKSRTIPGKWPTRNLLDPTKIKDTGSNKHLTSLHENCDNNFKVSWTIPIACHHGLMAYNQNGSAHTKGSNARKGTIKLLSNRMPCNNLEA